MPCTSAACCRRHPRACAASAAVHSSRCASSPLPEAHATATVTVASADAVSSESWHSFYCQFASLGDVYVGAPEAPPCSRCKWTFVRLQRRWDEDEREARRADAWGRWLVVGLAAVWRAIVATRKRYRWLVFCRVNMQWLVPPLQLVRRVQALVSTPSPVALVPDTESNWGVNDRFGIVNEAAAEAYFDARSSLLRTSGAQGNTESVLAAALKAARVAVLTLPTLGTLACCKPEAPKCYTRLCLALWVNDTATAARGRTLAVKYIFEAQSAVQNAEAVVRGTSSLTSRCDGRGGPDAWSACERPASPRSPHHCAPQQGLCLRPPPAIAWRALWRRNSTAWYRWLSPPPWSDRAG